MTEPDELRWKDSKKLANVSGKGVHADDVEPLFTAETIKQHFQLKDLVNQLAIAHRHMDEHDIQGEAKENNEKLQRKIEEFLKQKGARDV